MIRKNLFVTLMRLSDRKEDFFTEVLAAALAVDSQLAREFFLELVGPEIGGIRVAEANIEVRTQWGHERVTEIQPGAVQVERSRVDLVVTLNGILTIGIEVKLFAPEGNDQLGKYLRTDLGYLAFITGYDAPMADHVFEQTRYVRPRTGRRHFIWTELNPVVDRAARRGDAHEYVKGLRALFAHLGFERPDDEFGDPRDPDPEKLRKSRENFKRAWELRTKPALQARGWRKFERDNTAALWASVGPSEVVDHLWLDPIHQPGVIRMRVAPRQGTDTASLRDAVLSPGLPFDIEVVVAKTVPGSTGERKREVVDIFVSVSHLFAGTKSAEEKAERMHDFVVSALNRIDPDRDVGSPDGRPDRSLNKAQC